MTALYGVRGSVPVGKAESKAGPKKNYRVKFVGPTTKISADGDRKYPP